MSTQRRDSSLDWLKDVQPVGMVVAPSVLQELGLPPAHQTAVDTAQVAEVLNPDQSGPALRDPWGFVQTVLGWDASYIAGSPGGPELPLQLRVRLPEHDILLEPTWAVAEPEKPGEWQLLVRVEAPDVDPDTRGNEDGWEATPHQRLERLLRETGVPAGVIITGNAIRLIHAPRWDTSGHLSFPLRPLATPAGGPMLAGLKLLLHSFRLFSEAGERRLPALLTKSRQAQTSVSTQLGEQVLGALHELLRGLDQADPAGIRELARKSPEHLYEGLLTVLMRLVFIVYAEDRELLPSRTDSRSREAYEKSYSVRGLHATLVSDAVLNPETIDERRGGWGRLLELFRLIHHGNGSGLIQARGGKLFDPEEFPFLEGRAGRDEHKPRILPVSDGCLHRVLENLLTLQRGPERESLSYRTLDPEQIGSACEAVMGFTVQQAQGQVLAIRAGKNNRTPVFVDLDELLKKKGKQRIKDLNDNAGRNQLSATQAKDIQSAKSTGELAAALAGIVDERASPRSRIFPADTPILQPNGERRRSGSYGTPRSLTTPIVQHALEPAFERMGPHPTPDEILELKVCDLAVGSGAFLVEACRYIADRLVQAWEHHRQRPELPPDEDEQLHARRLVAQRCLYGVDKSPRVIDLARLSLWLLTLARDHELTFLDHALKCGDSLVGLTCEHMRLLHWEVSPDQSRSKRRAMPMLEDMIGERFDAAARGRSKIREAGDGEHHSVQEARHREVEQQLRAPRLIGDALVAAFFSSQSADGRKLARRAIEQSVHEPPEIFLAKLESNVATLRSGSHHVLPFHWELEFPEVFARQNAGFDAIVGHPPFAGRSTILSEQRESYIPWLQTLHEGAHGWADQVAHFFRRAFFLLRPGGVFGLIATSTVGQGRTRVVGLWKILLRRGGAVTRAWRRVKWPGEADVVVSVVHVAKGEARSAILDGRRVRRISSYLVEGNPDIDGAPHRLVANARLSFESFSREIIPTFDDKAAAKGKAESLAAMEALISRDRRNKERIIPYIAGEDLESDPRQLHHRYAIDFEDYPLCRDAKLGSWCKMDDEERKGCLQSGVVPADYPEPTAEDWPDLLKVLQRLMKPEQARNDRNRLEKWWRQQRVAGLKEAMESLGCDRVLAVSRDSPHCAFALLPTRAVYAESLVVFTLPSHGSFSILQSRVYEHWMQFFSWNLEDRVCFGPSDCFSTFPFPPGFELVPGLGAMGDAYYRHRADLMVRCNEGLTKTYDRFHARSERSPDIDRLRTLQAEMDAAVLCAYGWDDLAQKAVPVFIEQQADDGKTLKTRLDWPVELKEEVLARLLWLNAYRAGRRIEDAAAQ